MKNSKRIHFRKFHQKLNLAMAQVLLLVPFLTAAGLATSARANPDEQKNCPPASSIHDYVGDQEFNWNAFFDFFRSPGLQFSTEARTLVVNSRTRSIPFGMSHDRYHGSLECNLEIDQSLISSGASVSHLRLERGQWNIRIRDNKFVVERLTGNSEPSRVGELKCSVSYNINSDVVGEMRSQTRLIVPGANHNIFSGVSRLGLHHADPRTIAHHFMQMVCSPTGEVFREGHLTPLRQRTDLPAAVVLRGGPQPMPRGESHTTGGTY